MKKALIYYAIGSVVFMFLNSISLFMPEAYLSIGLAYLGITSISWIMIYFKIFVNSPKIHFTFPFFALLFSLPILRSFSHESWRKWNGLREEAGEGRGRWMERRVPNALI
jgi:hypothetical protein